MEKKAYFKLFLFRILHSEVNSKKHKKESHTKMDLIVLYFCHVSIQRKTTLDAKINYFVFSYPEKAHMIAMFKIRK
jgi:hypothetical protein